MKKTELISPCTPLRIRVWRLPDALVETLLTSNGEVGATVNILLSRTILGAGF